MTTKEFKGKYFTHEVILKECSLDRKSKQASFVFAYCEWQLEELNDGREGYVLHFENVECLNCEEIFNLKEEFVLALVLKKNRFSVCLDCDYYAEFAYSNFVVEDVKK